MYRKSKELSLGDTFIGYHQDTAASIVMNISNSFELDQPDEPDDWAKQVTTIIGFVYTLV